MDKAAALAKPMRTSNSVLDANVTFVIFSCKCANDSPQMSELFKGYFASPMTSGSNTITLVISSVLFASFLSFSSHPSDVKPQLEKIRPSFHLELDDLLPALFKQGRRYPYAVAQSI